MAKDFLSNEQLIVELSQRLKTNQLELLKQLEATPNNQMTKEGYEYRLSVGKDGKTKFIHRFPLVEVKK